MQQRSLWRPESLVMLALALTFSVTNMACATKRAKVQELSQEVPVSAFNEDNWDTYKSERNYRTTPAVKQSFKSRVKTAKRGSGNSSVAGN